MKKFYPFFMYLLAVLTTSAQCTIDSSNIPVPGVYPQPSNLPHIQQSTFYDQTIQGRVKSEGDTLILGATFHYTVEFMRVDSITGLPPGISWAKSPNAIPGGGVGCLRFYGTTNAAAGTYPLV
ncbi:MAG TPA: hypothetical protein VK174_11100, partial [Chitinophagales bacterium]|nr:hypothetical protein [Chitinophagales bacterium]